MALLVKAGRNQDDSLYLVIARLNLDSGNLVSAKNALTRADELSGEGDPHVAECEELWGMLKEKMGATREAIQRFRRAVDADPSRDYSLLRLAQLNAQLKLWKDAMAWMERYIATKPVPIALYWALLGEYRLAAGQMEPGINALETALHHDPYSFRARNRLATLFIRQKASDRAVEQLEFLTKYAFDRDPNLYIKLADLYTSSGRMGDARRLLRKGARIFPTDLNIHHLYRSARSGERD
jgi:tetratricopeptide (TPR) repeat protein